MKSGPAIPVILACAAALAFGGCSTGGGKEPAPEGAVMPASAHASAPVPTAPSGSDLKFTAPAGWIPETPGMSLRKAQYRLPKAGGDSEDAELVVYHFGQGQGGGLQANIDRWVNQFTRPDGSPVTDAKTSHRASHGIPLTIVDISGTYVAGMGAMSDGKPKPAYRMLAVVADTPNGPWFFKLTGPSKTVARWETDFQSFLDSIQQPL